jgi:hypothetical protein
MPTIFKNEVVTGIGTEPVDILQIIAGVRATIVGLNLANTSDFDMAVVNVYVIDESSTVANYARQIPIPPGASAKVITNGERLILPETAGMRIECDTDNCIDASISYVEIT